MHFRYILLQFFFPTASCMTSCCNQRWRFSSQSTLNLTRLDFVKLEFVVRKRHNLAKKKRSIFLLTEKRY